jgi:hypothetical protein
MSNPSLAYQALLGLHFVGLALGLGGATISDFSFFRNLRLGDRISPETVNWMRSFSVIVWAGIGLLTLSGIGLFMLNPSKYIHSTGFAVKMIFVLILIINGLFLNFYTTARLTTFNFSEKYPRRDAAWKARKLSFIFGAISATTWYATLFIAMFKSLLHIPFIAYIISYVFVLSFAIAGSLLLERLLFTRAQTHPKTLDLNNTPISHLANYSAATVKARIAQNAATPPVPQPPSAAATRDPTIPQN